MRHVKQLQTPKTKAPDQASVIGNISAMMNEARKRRGGGTPAGEATGPSSASARLQTPRLSVTAADVRQRIHLHQQKAAEQLYGSQKPATVADNLQMSQSKMTALGGGGGSVTSSGVQRSPPRVFPPLAPMSPSGRGHGSPPGTASGRGGRPPRFLWTNGGTEKENATMLQTLTCGPAQMHPPSTVSAPMISLVAPMAPPRPRDSNGLPADAQVPVLQPTDAFVPAPLDESGFPSLQRSKFKFSCEYLDGSLQSKQADLNRQRATMLLLHFNNAHDRKVAFYKKYRSPDPSDEDYDAFSAAALGPFDLQRNVTELDFHNPTESALFDSHYAEILTLFTDDSFVKALSVGGEVDKELLRLRSKCILQSGGTALQGMDDGTSPTLKKGGSKAFRHASQQIIRSKSLKTEMTDVAMEVRPPVTQRTAGEELVLAAKVKKAKEIAEANAAALRAKEALQSLFSQQQQAHLSDSDDGGDGNDG